MCTRTLACACACEQISENNTIVGFRCGLVGRVVLSRPKAETAQLDRLGHIETPTIVLFSEICSHAHAHASVRVHTSWSVLVCFQVSFPQKKHRNINNENYLFSCGGRPMRGVNDTLCWYPLVCIQVHSSQYCVHLFFPGIFRIQWKSHFRNDFPKQKSKNI